MDVKLTERVRFGEFEFDLKAGELRQGDCRVVLREQPFQILRMLVEHRGQVVTRDEIKRKLWPNDTVVEFDHSIQTAISKLRQALGDSAADPKYVETVARRGYRLIPKIESSGDSLSNSFPAGGGAAASFAHAPASRTDGASARNLIGKKVSHYRVLEVVGGGGMGVVYKAEDIKLGRRVALKFLPEELVNDPTAMERFEREARAISALDHPNICTIHEVEEHEGQPFIVMQLLQGQTLRDRIESSGPGQSAFSRGELLDVASQIVAALDAAHQKGIIHRDIKPANIFLTHRGEVKLLDFGLVKLVDMVADRGEWLSLNPSVSGREDHAFATDASQLGLTLTGATLGTASYMSPEQVRKEPVDARSDLFSFGAVFYEMATGHQAFCGDSPDLIHDTILNYTPPSPLALNPSLPAELESVIMRALEKDRQNRYQSASEISADLQQLKLKESELASGTDADEITRAGRTASAGSGVEDEATPRPPIITPDTRIRDRKGGSTAASHFARRFWRAGWLFILAATLSVAAAIFFRRREVPQASAPEVKLRRLTSNPNDDPIRSGVISADGKYLAYADLGGLHVRLVDTGETRNVPETKELAGKPVYWRVVGWFPNGTSFIANSTLPPEYGPQHPSVWNVSVLAGDVRKIRDDAEAWSISPDGSMITFSESTGSMEGRSLWMMGPSGEQVRKAFDADEGTLIVQAQWSPDGRRLAYIRYSVVRQKSEAVIESRDVQGGPATTILSMPGYSVQDYLWLPDGRMISSLNEPPSTDCNFWTLRIDSRTGKPKDNPRKLTNWAGFCMDTLSMTGDTRKLAFVEWVAQAAVYVADVHAAGARIDNVRLLTSSLGWSQASSWSADSKTILVRSNRDGRWRIYKQSLDGKTAEPLIREPEEAIQARVLGPWVIYEIWPSDANRCTTSAPVMRIPFAGGPPEELFKAPIHDVRCGRVSCIAIECSQDLKQFVFRAFDPIQGLGRELARADRQVGNNAFSLSPDGTQIAMLPSLQQTIDIYPVSGGSPSKVKVKDWPMVDNVNWAADGKGLYVFSPTRRGSVLLYVDLEGNARVIWEQLGGLQSAGIPSLDGRHLAIRGWTVNSNVWLMENF